jgi:hypothetical protein
MRRRVQSAKIFGIARHDWFSALSGEQYDRSVDDIGHIRGTAEFSACTGQVVVKRNNLDFVASQESR